MIRTQVQLTEDQFRRLKSEASRRGVSLAELVRQGIEKLLAGSAEDIDVVRKRRALAAVGRFSSKSGDVARDHDRYFSESIEGDRP